jgi:hypothetical protein
LFWKFQQPDRKPIMKALVGCALALFCLVFLASSCVKDPDPIGPDPNNPGGTNTSIRFTCYQDTVILPGVFIGITPNQADRDNGVFLFSGTSNSAGYWEFKNLEALTYWYSASYGATGGAIVKEGSITLDKGDNVRRDLNF